MDTAAAGHLGQEGLDIRQSHVVAADGSLPHRGVQADEVKPLSCQQVPRLRGEVGPGVMAVEDGLTALLADIDQTLLPLVMVGGDGDNLPVTRTDNVSPVRAVEMHRVVQRVGLEAVDQDMLVKCLFDRLVAIDVQYPLRAVAEVLMAVNQLGGKPVIHVAVGDQKGVNPTQIQAVAQGVAVGVRRKVQ